MSNKTIRAYDEMVYPSLLHPQTHPDRLATIGILLGLKPKPIENCRVLELGCGNGTNSIVFAYSLPNSEFIGIDLSEKQISDGNEIVKSTGLENLSLVHGDVLDIESEELGKFDYIIAHGFYSWTPEEVRDKGLEICREMLNENGIAFVSYNTNPGFHLKKMMRQMMLFHTRNEISPPERVNIGMDFLKFLSESVGTKEVFGKILEKEFQHIKRNPLSVVFHDELEDINTPFYFHEFIEHAEKHDLQFVSEIEYFTFKNASYSSEVREYLQNFEQDRVLYEQHMDFLCNRRFRQTLLCHKEAKINIEPKAEFLHDLRISADIHAQSENCDLTPQTLETFIGKDDNRFQLDHALTKAAIGCLREVFPRSIPFPQLIEKASEILKKRVDMNYEMNENDGKILGEVLLQLYSVKLADFRVHDPDYVDLPGERPLVSHLARWQIQKGFDEIITLRFENLKIENKFARKLLSLFDGTRTFEDVQQELESDAEFEFESEFKRQEFVNELPEMIEENLKKLSGFGLFVS